MADQVIARPATSADLEAVRDLALLAREESEDERGGELLFDVTHSSVGEQHRYSGVLSDASGALFVVEVLGAIVGYTTAHLEHGTSLKLCAIDELFVHPKARSVGAGAALLTQVQHWGRGHGCSHVESQVLPGNRAAKNFFERVGMVTRAMRVSARLDAD